MLEGKTRVLLQGKKRKAMVVGRSISRGDDEGGEQRMVELYRPGQFRVNNNSNNNNKHLSCSSRDCIGFRFHTFIALCTYSKIKGKKREKN